MKKNTAIILLCSLFFLIEGALFVSRAIAAPGNCPDAVTAYWRLDETAAGLYADAIGSHHGVCTTVDCPGGIIGTVGMGQLFEGAEDTITVDAIADLNWLAVQSFTVELWMRRDTGSIGNGLEVFIGRADATGMEWYMGINAAGNAQALLQAANGSGPGALTGSKNLTSSTLDPTWHHVALVRNGDTSTTTLYVDGQATASQAFDYTTGFSSDTSPLTLGSLSGGNHFNGGLDEVAIYGRALNADEIRGHYFVSKGYCDRYDAPLRIMPLGDSITRGNWNADLPPDSDMVGYRLDLWDLLENNLYGSDFIGSQHHGSATSPDFDDAHAGFGGITDDQLFTLLSTGRNEAPNPAVQITPGPYLETYPTEVILLHIGTNQLDTDTIAVSNTLDEIDAFSKNITVLVARIINRSPTDPDVPIFNNNIVNMVTGRIAQGDKIIMVDIETAVGLDYAIDTTSPYTSGDMYDLLHPNPSGYNRMAGGWFAALEGISPQSEIPVITSTAPTEVTKGQLYTYTVTATGPPSPTFSLTTQPTGMSIDPVSGLIQWTPTEVADHAVTIQALNWAGADTQMYNISVNALPQAFGDSYDDILEGDTTSIPSTEGVLKNDTDENDPLTAILVDTVTNGTLVLNADGSFIYTHDGSESFNDNFTYKASDGKADSGTVSVALSITPVNDPPLIIGQGELSTTPGTAIQISLANLIIEDPDNKVPDDMTLFVQEGGNYTLSGINAIVPNAGITGEVSVSVTVTDGTDESARHSLTISVTPNGGSSGDGGGGGGGCFIESLF